MLTYLPYRCILEPNGSRKEERSKQQADRRQAIGDRRPAIGDLRSAIDDRREAPAAVAAAVAAAASGILGIPLCLLSSFLPYFLTLNLIYLILFIEYYLVCGHIGSPMGP